MKTILISYVVMVVVGVGLYYGYTRLPAEWRAKVAGWKTNGTAAILAFAPDAMMILNQIQALSDLWTPSETVNLVMKGVAVLMVVLRYITSREQKEQL